MLSTQTPLFPALVAPFSRSLYALGQVDLAIVLEDPRALFQVLKKAILVPEAQSSEFALCELLVETDEGKYITPKIFPLLINLLGDFATLGSVGAEWEQRNDVLQKRVKPAKTPDRPCDLLLSLLTDRHGDQIARAKIAVEFIYILHHRAKLLIQESEDPASGIIILCYANNSLGSISCSYFRLPHTPVNQSLS